MADPRAQVWQDAIALLTLELQRTGRDDDDDLVTVFDVAGADLGDELLEHPGRMGLVLRVMTLLAGRWLQGAAEAAEMTPEQVLQSYGRRIAPSD